MKTNEKQAISLIVLVITIIIMAILAATVIITLSNTNVINEANNSVEKANLSAYKERYTVYLADRMMDDSSFRKATLNISYASNPSEFEKIFGTNVGDDLKNKLSIENGELVFTSSDEKERANATAAGIKAEAPYRVKLTAIECGNGPKTVRLGDYEAYADSGDETFTGYDGIRDYTLTFAVKQSTPITILFNDLVSHDTGTVQTIEEVENLLNTDSTYYSSLSSKKATNEKTITASANPTSVSFTGVNISYIASSYTSTGVFVKDTSGKWVAVAKIETMDIYERTGLVQVTMTVLDNTIN
mgnify:CR=1 FL=1